MNTYSVIITTHDRPAFLGRAISSVKAQTDVRHQIVVVSDDASADTYKVASDLLSNEDVFVQRGGQPGPAASRNFGTLLAKGDYVIFLDDDDAFSPDYLYEANRHASKAEVLYTDYYSVFERLDNGSSVLVGGERRSLAAKDLNSIHVKNFIPPACFDLSGGSRARARNRPFSRPQRGLGLHTERYDRFAFPPHTDLWTGCLYAVARR